MSDRELRSKSTFMLNRLHITQGPGLGNPGSSWLDTRSCMMTLSNVPAKAAEDKIGHKEFNFTFNTVTIEWFPQSIRELVTL